MPVMLPYHDLFIIIYQATTLHPPMAKPIAMPTLHQIPLGNILLAPLQITHIVATGQLRIMRNIYSVELCKAAADTSQTRIH